MADDSFRIQVRMRIRPGQRDAFERLIRELTAGVETEGDRRRRAAPRGARAVVAGAMITTSRREW